MNFDFLRCNLEQLAKEINDKIVIVKHNEITIRRVVFIYPSYIMHLVLFLLYLLIFNNLDLLDVSETLGGTVV